jgi:hypothetical protein
VSWFGAIEVGDHVRAHEDLSQGCHDQVSGRPSIRRGRTGIVREVDHGFFTDRVTVEFHDGLFTRTVSSIPSHRLRKTGGQGEGAFQRGRTWRRGVRLGLLLANVPLLIALVRYFLAGGTTAGLVPAALDAALGLVVVLLGHPPVALVVVGAVALRVRSRAT